MAEHFPELCPTRVVFDILGDKWSLLAIRTLCTGGMRNSELMRAMPGISPKMLAQTLRALVRDGLVARTDFHEVPPRVEYRLTPLGASLRPPLETLSAWADAHHREIDAARAAYDASAIADGSQPA